MEHTDSQCDQILKHLQQGHELTQLDALNKFQCFSLTQRVHDLKNRGHNITTEMIKLPSGKRIAKYKLVGQLVLV